MTSKFEALKREIESISDNAKSYALYNKKLVFNLLNKLDGCTQDEQHELLTALNAGLSLDYIVEPLAKRSRSLGVDISSTGSFRTLLTIGSQRRKFQANSVERILNGKARGYKFADYLGVKRPQVFYSTVALDKVELLPNTVLKPNNGSASKGVFLVFDYNDILEVRTGTRLRSEHEVKKCAKELLSSGVVQGNYWTVEELVLGSTAEKAQPARDLKFYTFYGEVGLVLEVERSNGGRYCEWSSEGQRINTGRYNETSFDGDSFTKEQLETAKLISQKIPSPFMRIDFIKSSNSFMFGEFTPLPGQYHSFNAEYDRYLGQLLLASEARLASDFIQGKSFNEFNKLAGIK
ncbi:MAG: hypothetical protein M1473_09210 [Firmicutes bacterium]|nr:hypothetical protein [Bacillota bacterium]